MAKVVHEIEKCIGCGACTSVCGKFWSLGPEGKAVLKGAKTAGKNKELTIKDADIACNRQAADVCPVQCIRIG